MGVNFRKLVNWGIILFTILFTSIVFILMIYNIFKNYIANSPTYYLLRLIIAISFILLISYILYKMTDQKIWLNRLILIVLILIFIVIALFWVRITPRTQLSDFGNFWYRAPDVLKGQKLYAFDNDYFAKWAYQTGFMAYVMLVIKIFGYGKLQV